MGGDERLEGLGGWLIPIGFIIVTGAFSTAVSLIELADQGLRGGASSGVSWFAIGVQFTLLVVELYMMYLFFTKNRRFPTVFSLVLVIGLIIMIVLGLTTGFYGRPLIEIISSRVLLIQIAATVLLLVYIERSERVRLTFTQ